MIVVDSSVALQWVLPEEGASIAERLMGRPDLVAPDILLIESANVLAKKVRAGDANMAGAYAGLKLISDTVPVLDVTVDLLEDAIRLSVELVHPLYDCCFLACALRRNAQLATRDRRLASRMSEAGFGERLYAPVLP